MHFRQEEFHDRLQEIQHQAKVSRDEMNNCKNEVAQLERKLRKKEMEVQDISKEVFFLSLLVFCFNFSDFEISL